MGVMGSCKIFDEIWWKTLSKSTRPFIDEGWEVVSAFPTYKQCIKAIDELYQRQVDESKNKVTDIGELRYTREKLAGVETITMFTILKKPPFSGKVIKNIEVDYRCLPDTVKR